MPKLTEQKAERAEKRRRTEALKAEAQGLRREAKRREWEGDALAELVDAGLVVRVSKPSGT